MFYNMRKQLFENPFFYAVMAVIFWATVAVAFKLSLRFMSAYELLIFSVPVSAGSLFLLLVYSRKLSLLLCLTRKNILHLSLSGLLNPVIYYLILFHAYDILPAQQAQPLNFTWPIMLILLSVPLLKNKISKKDFLGILISFSGVIIIATQGNIGDFFQLERSQYIGVALALGSSILWALFWISNQKTQLDPLVSLFVNFMFGTLYCFLAVFFIRPVSLPKLDGILGAVYVGVFEMGITFYFWAKALLLAKGSTKVSHLIYLCPFLSLLFIALFVGEVIHVSSVFGLIIIISGLLFSHRRVLNSPR